jgi:hypothetical protein
MATVDGLGMDTRETKVAMPLWATLNNQDCVTFDTQVAWWIKKCRA